MLSLSHTDMREGQVKAKELLLQMQVLKRPRYPQPLIKASMGAHR